MCECLESESEVPGNTSNSYLVEKILWSRRWFSQGEVCLLIALRVCGPLWFPQMSETILHNLWYWGTALTLSPGHMCEYQISVKFSFSKTPCFGCFSGGIVFGCVLVFLVLCCQFLSYKYWLVYESWTSCFWLLLINKIALVGLVVLFLVVCCRAWIDWCATKGKVHRGSYRFGVKKMLHHLFLGG